MLHVPAEAPRRTAGTISDPIAVPDGQPTWCRRLAPLACPIFGKNAAGERVMITTGVPVDLHYVGVNDDGIEVWKVPASAWTAGDRIELGPLPADVAVIYEADAPNGGRA